MFEKKSATAENKASEISIQDFQQRFQFEEDFVASQMGEFPVVFKAKDQVKQVEVAIKVTHPEVKAREKLTGELKKQLDSLSDPHILRPRETFAVVDSTSEKQARKFEAIVFDYVNGGNLAEYAKKGLTSSDKVFIIKGILSGLEAIHRKKLIHGNLKPTNILVHDVGHPHIYLTDVGLTPGQEFKDLNVNFAQDSIRYVAPELLYPEDYPQSGSAGIQVDFWALGLIVYELLGGTYPFGESNPSNTELAARIRLMDISRISEPVPTPYQAFIESCLQRDPAKRPKSMKEVRALLPKQLGGNQKSAPTPKENTATKSISQLFSRPKAPKITCKHCGNLNEADRGICRHCKNALGGPASLSAYRNPTAIGTWAIIFFTLILIPIGLFYWDLYQACDFQNGGCDLIEEVSKMNTTDENTPMSDEELALGLLAVGFMILSLILYNVFFSWWLNRIDNNLDAFGSKNKNTYPRYLFIGLMLISLFSQSVRDFFGDKLPLFIGVVILVQIIMSLHTLQVIWKGSNPSFLVPGEAWKKSKGSFLILSRWTLSFLFPLLLIFPFLPFSNHVETSKTWFFFGVGMSALYWLISIFVILRTSWRQNTKFQAMAKL